MTSLFELSLGGFVGDLRVVGFEGSEAMNRLYRFDIRLTVPGADAAGFAEKALEMPATLTMRFGAGDHRTVHGVVTGCQAVGRSKSGLVFFSIRLEPRMVLLRRRRTTRIFQDISTKEIVSAVLAPRGIAQRWRLGRELPKRAYAVQYDETDYAFVTRLLAEEGLMFSFDQPRELGGDGTNTGMGRSEVVVITDTAESYAPIEGVYELPFRGPDHEGMVQDEEHIQAFSLRHRVRSKGVLLRGFDAEKPPLTPRDAATTEGAPRIDRPEAMRTLAKQDMTIYEPQHTREEALTQPVLAANYLEAERATARIADGRSACRRLLPGRKLRLIEHELPEIDGEYVVVSCDHVGWAPEAAPDGAAIYRNEFTCAPADVPQRPRRPRSKPRQTLETAVVTGPAGQEIHTDELGRIKVQFHWDLDGELDERSSCWLRVAQAWAGAGFGAQFIPRVGSEVLVGFIAGDPDRPVVTGCLHNGVSPNPWSLPRDNTRSGILTRSTPGPGATNELSFQDRTGDEEVVLRSAKTLSVSSLGDAVVRSGADLRVESAANRAESVELDSSEKIGGSSDVRIAGSQFTEVGGDVNAVVQGTVSQRIDGSASNRTLGAETRMIGAGRYTVVGNAGVDAADDIYSVSGSFRVGCVQGLSLTSTQGIDLRVGGSRILIQPDKIVIESKEIKLQALESIAALQGPEYGSSSLVLDGGAALAGGKVMASSGLGATLVLDADAKLDGALVKLNCGGEAGGGAKPFSDDERRGTVRYRVLRDGLPPDVANVTLVVSTPSGEIVERECPVGGEVEFVGRPNESFLLLETRVKGQPAPTEQVKDEETPNE